MNLKTTVLAAACALVLLACGNNSSLPATTAATPRAATTAQTEASTATASAPTEAATSMSAMSSTTAAANGKPTAVVTNCSTEIEGSDAMQYNVSSIIVPASCSNFEITLKHTGKLPVASMGHDVVITKKSDMAAVDAESAAAGLDAGYIKADDQRIIAHTKLIGAGETTSVSFAVSKIQSGGPYEFFCSFPGHSALMHGSISVE